jgi:hypothetical protein
LPLCSVVCVFLIFITDLTTSQRSRDPEPLPPPRPPRSEFRSQLPFNLPPRKGVRAGRQLADHPLAKNSRVRDGLLVVARGLSDEDRANLLQSHPAEGLAPPPLRKKKKGERQSKPRVVRVRDHPGLAGNVIVTKALLSNLLENQPCPMCKGKLVPLRCRDPRGFQR